MTTKKKVTRSSSTKSNKFLVLDRDTGNYLVDGGGYGAPILFSTMDDALEGIKNDADEDVSVDYMIVEVISTWTVVPKMSFQVKKD
jgi:hypothetical protein